MRRLFGKGTTYRKLPMQSLIWIKTHFRTSEFTETQERFPLMTGTIFDTDMWSRALWVIWKWRLHDGDCGTNFKIKANNSARTVSDHMNNLNHHCTWQYNYCVISPLCTVSSNTFRCPILVYSLQPHIVSHSSPTACLKVPVHSLVSFHLFNLEENHRNSCIGVRQ